MFSRELKKLIRILNKGEGSECTASSRVYGSGYTGILKISSCQTSGPLGSAELKQNLKSLSHDEVRKSVLNLSNGSIPSLNGIKIVHSTLGAPRVLTENEEEFSVSISRSRNRSVSLVFDRLLPIGVDIESTMNLTSDHLKGRFGKEALFKMSKFLDDKQSVVALWSLAEALGKALGCGLACNFGDLATRNVVPVSQGGFLVEYRNYPEYCGYLFCEEEWVISLCFKMKHRMDLLNFGKEFAA